MDLTKKEEVALELRKAVKKEFINTVEIINKNKECIDAEAYVKLSLAVKSLEALHELSDGNGEELKQTAIEKYGEEEFDGIMKSLIKGLTDYAIETLM